MDKITSILKKEFSILIGALVLGILCVLIIPLNEAYDINLLQKVWALIGVILAFFGVFKLDKSVFLAVFSVLVGLTMAHILRIAIEVKSDLSSHNLAGIEVIMVNIYLVIASIIGGLLGYFLKKMSKSK